MIHPHFFCHSYDRLEICLRYSASSASSCFHKHFLLPNPPADLSHLAAAFLPGNFLHLMTAFLPGFLFPSTGSTLPGILFHLEAAFLLGFPFHLEAAFLPGFLFHLEAAFLLGFLFHLMALFHLKMRVPLESDPSETLRHFLCRHPCPCCQVYTAVHNRFQNYVPKNFLPRLLRPDRAPMPLHSL